MKSALPTSELLQDVRSPLVVLDVLQLPRVMSASLPSPEWFGEKVQKAENYLG